MNLTGAEQFGAKLQNMGKKAGNAYLKAALREGGVPVLAAEKSLIHDVTGTLGNSLKIRAGRSGKGVVSVLIGAARKYYKGKAFYANYVDEGHYTGGRIVGKFRGRDAKATYHAASRLAGRKFIPGQHFIERALSSSKSAAEAAITKKLGELIAKDAS